MILSLTLTAYLSLGGLPAGATEQPQAPQLRPWALAQEKPPSKKRKVIRLDALTIEGRIQKPQAFYILQRSNLTFDELNRTETFIPRVEQSVENDPF